MNDTQLLGNARPFDRLTLQRLGLIQLATGIAIDNPTNMGAGTSPMQVIEAIGALANTMPSRISNGDSVKAAREDFRHALGVR